MSAPEKPAAPPGPPGGEDARQEARREPWVTKDLGAQPTPGSGPRVIAEEPPQSTFFAQGAIVADKYLIEGIIGEGGLGVVVSATHLHLDQKVAIKYLRGSGPRDRAMTDRFLREARLAAQIRSEHVVRVFDVATLPDGTPYMVMEYLEGIDLRTRLSDQGPVPFRAAIDYVLQACEALAEAHVQGIVHRDLKPDNLFLARGSGGKDVVKILDFGISKLSDKYTSSSRVNVVTQAGDRLGTPLYMSPEQLEGAPDIDARTDLWAMGVVIYELCTGEIPFTGDSLPALCTAILTKTPAAPSTLITGLPPELDLIVARCLAKARDDRYQNVAELAAELAPFASIAGQARARHTAQVVLDSGDVVRPPRWGEGFQALVPSSPPSSLAASMPATTPATPSRGALIGAFVAACLVVVGIGWWWTGSGTTPTNTTSVTNATPAVTATPATATAATAPPSAFPGSGPAAPGADRAPADPSTGVVPPVPSGIRSAVTGVPAPSVAAPAAPAVARRPLVPATSPVAPSARPPTASAPASADTTGVLDPFQ